jgi:5-methyltetrahydropteroyltriglutamate--homocysteine methyltransferase
MSDVYAHGQTAKLGSSGPALDRLHAAEDEAIAGVVARQVDLGLDVITDGEFRRAAYSNSFYDAVDGLAPNPEPMRFRADDGSSVEYAAPPIVVTRLRKVASPAAAEAKYLSGLTSAPFKVTLPAGSRWCLPYAYRPDAAHGYATHRELIEDALAIQRQLMDDAVAAGCQYIQLDFPVYPMLVDRGWREEMEARGVDLDELLEVALWADAKAIEGLPAGVRTGLHICRGNHRSRWLFQGSLEAVAERMFGELPYDGFLVEWDDLERQGGYEAIRHIPEGRIAVMGLISSKSAALEREDDVLARLDEAARHLDESQLAISTQCGFASTWHGNEIDEDAQWRKLELVARVAERVWGDAA